MDQTPAALVPTRALPPGPFSVAEYYRLAEDGLLRPGDRVELIEGEIVGMNAVGSPHASAVKGLIEAFAPRIAKLALLSIQDPVRLDDRSEPEPDVALLVRRPDRYRPAHPGPRDVLLVIEVAETSLDYDRAAKGPLYARHGIGEYWIVNLGANVVEVHRDPGPDGYRSSMPFGVDALLTIAALPGIVVPVREFLP